MPIIFTITTELSCSSKLLYFSKAENIWIIQNGTFSLFDCYSSSFISCSSIVCSCSAWRLKHRRTAIYNERLHSLSSAKDNSLRIAFHDSMIPLSTIFYSSLPVVCRSETNISHGEVTTSAPSLRVCVCVNTRWIRQTKTVWWRCQHFSLCSKCCIPFSLWVGNAAIWCFLHWRGSLLMSPMPIWLTQWDVWWMRGKPTISVH